MAQLHIQREDNAGTVTLRIEGTFDGKAALQLRQLLDELNVSQVVLDFSRVREFFDLAVGVLTRSLAERQIQLKGLREHQTRMFRYFGIGNGARTEPAYYRAEDTLNA